MIFEFQEDYEFFDELLESLGGIECHQSLFDFRNPYIKRNEFNKTREEIFNELVKTNGNVCQLRCHPECTNIADELDHLIPLSSNVLNKSLRNLKGKSGKKVPAQSFGSNRKSNLVLACKRCNAFKKHRMPSVDFLEKILSNRR